MENTPQLQWQLCLAYIKSHMNDQDFKSWFTCVSFHSYDETNNVLSLNVPSKQWIEYIEGNYLKLWATSIKKHFANTELRYFIPKQKEEEVSEELEKKEVENPLDSHLNPMFTFDTFVEGNSNKMPLVVAKAIAQKFQNTFNPFFLYGPSGVGKTHLVNAIGLEMKKLHKNKRIVYVSAHLLQIQFTDAWQNGKYNDLFNFYLSLDTLIVDDIQEIAGKNKTMDFFFNLFNSLHLNQKQIIITCDRPPVSLEGMTDRLLSRFKWGMIAELESPDAKLRKDILNFLIKKNGLQFSQNIINFIANNVGGSIRNLEGTINSIMAYSINNNSEINMALAEKVISRVVSLEKKSVTIEEILSKVCECYSIKTQNLISASRKHSIAEARQVAIYLTQKHTSLSSSQIGNRIGRDHTTVLYSCNLVENRLNVDKEFRKNLEHIEKSLFNKKEI